jgi:4-diphosphocytidyl-2-C-methyl-D-erythritol kinase
MILFPNAKINLGLNILRKRPDRFHDIETLFLPIQLSDILEIGHSSDFQFIQTGITIDGDPQNNLVVKAFKIMQRLFGLGEVTIHLHKIIPFGAGLGGGSSDAAHTLLGLNQLFSLNLTKEKMASIAAELGSDCPFFIYNCPMLGEGRGEVLTPVELSLSGFVLVLVKPKVEVSTVAAYSNVVPEIPELPLISMLKSDVDDWKNVVVNGFENSVFSKYPAIEAIKEKFYQHGAAYASMSGSGSSVFGIFKDDPGNLAPLFHDCFYWKEVCR